MHSLCIQIPGHLRRFVRTARIPELEASGAVCALPYDIEEQTPDAIDPCILQFVIHEQDLLLLQEGFGEWLPSSEIFVLCKASYWFALRLKMW